MKKNKKNKISQIELKIEAITSMVNKLDLHVIMLAQKLATVLVPFDKFVEYTEFIQTCEKLREYTAEVEHKLSFEFYNMIGLKKILRVEFADLINKNREDITKILEYLKNDKT